MYVQVDLFSRTSPIMYFKITSWSFKTDLERVKLNMVFFKDENAGPSSRIW